jgi:hypothetical protein
MLLLIGCLEPYEPPEITETINILVVDGFLNSTDATAGVKLSHTSPIKSTSSGTPETNATVTVESEDGTSFTLVEKSAGYYSAEGVSLNIDNRYRLVIARSDNQRVVSDFIELTNSPPIDSISWEADADGVNIFANTHDTSVETGYYYWDYIETWEYNSPVSSYIKWENNVPVFRGNGDDITKCWRSLPSSKIVVGSSLRLAENVIQRFPIISLPAGSNKLSIKYSVLVRQRTLSKDEYDFWKELQKTTENLGSLFDPLPYQVRGNLRDEGDPNTEVLGVFSGGSVTEKRIFIGVSELPANLRKFPTMYCPLDTVCIFKRPNDQRCRVGLDELNGTELLVGTLYDGPALWGYTIGSPSCVDCREQGGTLTRPDFW